MTIILKKLTRFRQLPTSFWEKLVILSKKPIRLCQLLTRLYKKQTRFLKKRVG